MAFASDFMICLGFFRLRHDVLEWYLEPEFGIHTFTSTSPESDFIVVVVASFVVVVCVPLALMPPNTSALAFRVTEKVPVLPSEVQ